MKRFGLPYKYLENKIYNSRTSLYVKDPKLGIMQVPKSLRFSNMYDIIKINQKKMEFEKYLLPFGLKPTLPYSLEYEAPHHQFLNLNVILMPTVPGKEKPNCLYFKTGTEVSKFELKQYLMKLYNLPIFKIMVKINQGKIKRKRYSCGYYSRQTYKKWTVVLDTELGEENKHLQVKAKEMAVN